jgi:hypothetical protein
VKFLIGARIGLCDEAIRVAAATRAMLASREAPEKTLPPLVAFLKEGVGRP